MAVKTNTTVKSKGGKEYKYSRITRTVGHKLNANGVEVPVKKQFVGKSRTEAEQKYQDYMKMASQGIDDKNQYFGIVLENWINNFFVHDTHLAFNTRERYLSMWRRHVKDSELSYQPLNKVTASTIQHFYNHLDCPPSAIRKINNLFRRFYKYLEQENLARDFTGALVIPHEKRKHEQEEEIVTWTDKEIDAILNGFDKADRRFRYRFLIVLAYHTGCRVGELRALKYSDIDTKEQTITIKRQIVDTKELSTKEAVGKRTPEIAPLKSGSSYRTIPLNEEVMKELSIHKAWHKADQLKNGYRTDYIFTTSTGGFYDLHNLRRGLERYYDAIGIFPYKFNENGKPIHKSIHTYRHTFATWLVRNGVPIQVASALLGHSDINMTNKYYVGTDMEQKREAVSGLMRNGKRNQKVMKIG